MKVQTHPQLIITRGEYVDLYDMADALNSYVENIDSEHLDELEDLLEYLTKAEAYIREFLDNPLVSVEEDA